MDTVRFYFYTDELESCFITSEIRHSGEEKELFRQSFKRFKRDLKKVLEDNKGELFFYEK